jgi:hypothetical protein
MGLLLLFHPLLRRVWNSVYPAPQPGAEGRFQQRTSFDFYFAILFLVILHGFSAVKVMAILALNYRLATTLPKKYVPAATWGFNICILFANELSTGYKFRDMALFISGPPKPLSSLVDGPAPLVKLGEWLDSFGGLQPRWEILFNITILRLISFNLDYYWSLDRRSASPIEVRP